MNKQLLLISFLSVSQGTLFSMNQQLTHRRQNSVEKTFENRTLQNIKSEKCSFCLEQLLVNKGAIVLLPCKHTLHSNCFDTLKVQLYTSCPSCRGPLEIFDQEHEEDSDCCINFIHEFFDICVHSLKHNERTLSSVIHDCTSSSVTWLDIFKKCSQASEICVDDHVTF